MKIKRLDIIGFKSFVDKVSLDFQHGITGVVGPNGCGKSNVVDAIRWAMGEQNPRHLRGRAMEDVIFGGSETRKPHGMAQVSIVFDNSARACPPAYQDYAEIMVTRRLYRNGESEYLLNKTPCRLLDITELFMDTGVGARAYSIIEQGKVGMLVSAKPEERRALIEEAAGVTKFKARKKTALRKMDATKQNLVRLGDIIAEVRRQLGSLKRQAQRAEKFREYRGEAKRLELCLAGNRFQELSKDIDTVAKQEREQAAVLSRLDARLEEGELYLEQQQLQLSTVEAELNQAQEQVYQLASEIQRVESELVLAARQRENLQSQEEQLEQEQASLGSRQSVLEAEQQQLIQEGQDCASQLHSFTCSVAELDEALQEATTREQELTAQLETNRRELMELLAETSRLANRAEEIDRRLSAEVERREQIQADSIRIQEQQQQLLEQQQQFDDNLLKVRERQTEIAEETLEQKQRQQRFQQQLAEQDAGLVAVRQMLEKKRSQQESLAELERNLDGYAQGVQTLLAEKKRWPRIAADLLRVAAEDELAVELALGERLQAVPVANYASAAEALQLLSQQQARATLLLPEITASAPSFPAGTPLLELVQANANAAPQVAQLLAGVFLVDRVEDHLQQVIPAGVLLVDRSGACLNWRGELTGGATTVSNSGLLRKKRQLKELVQEIRQAEGKLDQQRQLCDQTRTSLQRLENEMVLTAKESHLLELQALEIEKDRQSLANDDARLIERLDLIRFDLEQIEEIRLSLQQEKQQMRAGSEQSAHRKQQLEELSSSLQDDLSKLRLRLESAREQSTEKRVALAALQQQERSTQASLERIASQFQDLAERRTLLLERRTAGQGQQQQLLQDDERLRIELNLLLDRREQQQLASQTVRERYEKERQLLDEHRDSLRSVRAEAEDLRKEVARLQVRKHELQVDAEHVRQGVLERYRVDLLDHQVPEATEDELARQQQQLTRMQQRIDALGEVNLMAIDEYREQEERYDFLTRQRDDLQQSLDGLQKAISQINRTTRRRFKETFELANEKFKQVFPRLFRGGQAELRLTDENDLLETGIEIIVQPPGKRLQNVNLLSGGEKALTAVALIFSLFLIKPTPFCMLDEVDAPLDDANIDRFAEMVREMTAQSQFIIITHSKRTMGIVDTMYGVTMQEPGVSKLVSVRMNDFEQVAATGT